MKNSSKMPKTFVIFVKQNNKDGYLRFRSQYDASDNIDFGINIEKNIKDASVFVNFDNVKKIAVSFLEKYNSEKVEIIDKKTMKVFHVKKENKKSKPR